MILSASKSQSMLVTGKRLPSQLTDCKLDIRFEKLQIEQIHIKKLLGTVIDDQLTFDDHFNLFRIFHIFFTFYQFDNLV